METKAIKKFESQGLSLLEQAKAITITDEETRQAAATFSVNARKAVKTIDAEFKPDIEKAHQLHKDLLARVKRLKAPFDEARGIVDGEIKRDWLEQERARREAQRKADLAAEAERLRQEEEAKSELDELIEAGKVEEAQALLESEVVVSNPVPPVAKVEQTVRTGAGAITVRKDITVEVVDKKAVIAAVATNRLPMELVDVNVGAAKRYAKAAGLKEMPGFRVVETVITSGRV